MLQQSKFRSNCLTAEIVGPAGSGKSTLVAAMRRLTNQVDAIDNYSGLRYWPNLVSSAICLTPVICEELLTFGRVSWPMVRRMTRLQASSAILRRRRASVHPIVVVDQGPLYTLAKLGMTNDERSVGARFHRWRKQMRAAAATALDLVIYLDAPDDELLHRVTSRSKRHAIKKATTSEAKEFLNRYRRHYLWLLDELGHSANTRVLHIDTSESPPDELAQQVLAACQRDQPIHASN